MKYELQDLLRVRDHRKERAQEDLLKAKHARQEAELLLQAMQKRLDDFIEKKPIYIQRIYDKALEKVQFKRNYVDLVNLKVSKLAECQMKLAIELEKAQNDYKAACEKVEDCAKTLMRAQVELSKIEEHKKFWQQEANALEELAQDKELEDFKTKTKNGHK